MVVHGLFKVIERSRFIACVCLQSREVVGRNEFAFGSLLLQQFDQLAQELIRTCSGFSFGLVGILDRTEKDSASACADAKPRFDESCKLAITANAAAWWG